MSTAEVQVKVLTVADVSGIERAKASFINLQGEIQKKMSAKGIGMSLLEGLGIGSGFRVADQIAEQIVKPFKEAADEAKSIADYNEIAANAAQEMARRRMTVEQLVTAEMRSQARLSERIAELQSKAGPPPWWKSVALLGPLFGGYQAFSNSIKSGDNAVELAKVSAAAAKGRISEDDAKRALATKELTESEKRVKELTAAQKEGEAANNAWVKKWQDAAIAIRASIDPQAALKKSIQEVTDAEALGFITAEEAAKATKKLNEEFNRPQQIRKSALALEEYRSQLDAIDRNPMMTDKQKREARVSVLRLENEEIRRQIQLLTEKLALDPYNSEDQSRLDQLNKDKRVNENSNIAPLTKIQEGAKAGMEWEDPAKHYQGGAEGFLGGAMEMLIEFGTLGDQIASSFKNVMGNAVQSISNGITGLIMRTQTWRQALSNIGLSILTSIVSAIVQMGVRWVATQIMMAAFGKAITAAAIATSIPLAMMATMIWAAPATLATIATFGGAAMQAPMSILSAQGLVMAGSLMQFAKGGLIPEGRRLIEVNEQGQEAVLNARATSTLGAGFINAVNSGEFANATQYITRPGFSPELQEGGAGAIERQEQGLGTIAVRGFNAAHEIQQHLESRPGKKWIVDLIRQEARRV
jgi:hypothetical protein